MFVAGSPRKVLLIFKESKTGGDFRNHVKMMFVKKRIFLSLKTFSGVIPLALFMPLFGQIESNQGPTFDEIKAQLWTRNPDFLAKKTSLAQTRLTGQSTRLLYGIPGVGVSVNLPNSVGFSSNFDRLVNSNTVWNGKVAVEQRLLTDTRMTLSLADNFDALSLTNIAYFGLEFSQPILRRNESRFAVESARRDEERAARNLESLRRDLEYRFENAWWDWSLSTAFVGVQERKRAKSSTNLAESERKYLSGLIKEVDVLSIRLNDQKVAATLETYRRDERDKRRNLWQFVLRPEFEDIAPRYLDPQSMLAMDAYRMDRVNYDLEASLQASLEAETGLLDRLDDAWKLEQDYLKQQEGMRPVGDLTASALKDLDANGKWNFKVGLSLATPLFDRGNGSRIAVGYRLAKDNLQTQIQGDRLDLKRDLKQRLAEMGEIRRQVQLAAQGRDVSQRIYQIDLKRFDLGLITSTILIDSENNAFDAELEASRQAVRWIKAIRYLETRYRMVRKAPAP